MNDKSYPAVGARCRERGWYSARPRKFGSFPPFYTDVPSETLFSPAITLGICRISAAISVKEEKKLHRQLQKEDRLQERLLRKDARRQSVKQAFANARDRLAGIFHAPGSYKRIDLEAELELEAAKAEPAEPAPGNAAGKDGQEGHA